MSSDQGVPLTVCSPEEDRSRVGGWTRGGEGPPGGSVRGTTYKRPEVRPHYGRKDESRQWASRPPRRPIRLVSHSKGTPSFTPETFCRQSHWVVGFFSVLPQLSPPHTKIPRHTNFYVDSKQRIVVPSRFRVTVTVSLVTTGFGGTFYVIFRCLILPSSIRVKEVVHLFESSDLSTSAVTKSDLSWSHSLQRWGVPGSVEGGGPKEDRSRPKRSSS